MLVRLSLFVILCLPLGALTCYVMCGEIFQMCQAGTQLELCEELDIQNLKALQREICFLFGLTLRQLKAFPSEDGVCHICDLHYTFVIMSSSATDVIC